MDSKQIQSERAVRLRAIVETFRIVQIVFDDTLFDSASVRRMAEELEVPYLLLYLEKNLDHPTPTITVKDIAAWVADPEAQAVMTQWIADEDVGTAEPAPAERAVA